MKSAAEPAARLARGLPELGLDAALAAPLLSYLDELLKWNAAYNLTAVRDPADMVTRHLLDSLALLPVLDARYPASARLLDVGSGAGLPGLVLALARPRWQVDVLDSNGKKARFLRHAARTLALGNVSVVEARVEAHEGVGGYDGILSRAFAALADFCAASAHLLAPGGLWLAMKGRLDENETAQLPAHLALHDTHRLRVPGLAEQRHLIAVTLREPS